ncbi:MAG: YdjY domain-containing protein [Planctomycetota bacterium]|nr:YdjY domain-containing protein [Planctomycetota bacterium]
MNTKFPIVLALLALSLPATAAEPTMTVDKDTKTITIPAKIAPRKLEYLSEIYPIEVVATLPHPKGKKAHETVVNFTVTPSDVHKALESFGLKPGKPAVGEGAVATGPEVKVTLEIPTADGGTQTVPIEKTLVDKKSGKPMPALKWYFTGSNIRQSDPTKEDKAYGADLTGTLIGIFPVTDDVVIQTNLTMKEEPLIKMETNKKLLPPEGTPVKLIIQVK